MAVISKSKYISGLQCEKLLWTYYNRKHLIPPPDPDTLWIFNQGHEAGRLAQQIVPGGDEVPFGRMAATVEATQKLLPGRKPIYEASFSAANVYCRVDILRPTADGRRDLLEVKSSTKVKDVNIADIAIQAHCLRAAGVELDRLFLVHIDRNYVRRGANDPDLLFHAEDVTESVGAMAATIAPNMDRFLAVIDGSEPDVPIGNHCDNPYGCPLKDRCWSFLPDDAVTSFARAGAGAFDWIDRGWLRVTDVPDARLSASQLVQSAAVKEGEPQIDRGSVRGWLDRLEYPILLLDFEAFATAVPVFDGTSPWQPVPFQVSVHTMDRPGSDPQHLEFLATEPDDPRPELVRFLTALPASGSVVAWHMSYERAILDRLTRDFPDAAVELRSLRDRLVDLEDPFRHFDYYHPAQKGSTSLKAVLPALAGLSYAGDAIEGGQQAAREFFRAVHGGVEIEERQRVLEALRKYCEKDTWAMVEILRVLERDS